MRINLTVASATPALLVRTTFCAKPALSIPQHPPRVSRPRMTPPSPAPPGQDFSRPPSHDVWGVGVIWLELLLGTTDVWSRLACTAPAALVHRLRQQHRSHNAERRGDRWGPRRRPPDRRRRRARDPRPSGGANGPPSALVPARAHTSAADLGPNPKTLLRPRWPRIGACVRRAERFGRCSSRGPGGRALCLADKAATQQRRTRGALGRVRSRATATRWRDAV